MRPSMIAVLTLLGSAAALLAARQSSEAEGAGRAMARPVGIVELYTSQGCSSCPTADLILKELAKRPDLVALSMPVDYWDYLGWRDTLASSKHSERQRAYARTRGDGMIYTPQVVVNGMMHVNGNRLADIDRAIATTNRDAPRVTLTLTRSNDRLIVEVGAAALPATAPSDDAPAPGPAAIWLAGVTGSVEVTVRGGENGGRKLTYANVARELIKVGKWTGKPTTIEVERASIMAPGIDHCVAIVQAGGTGRVAAAALLVRC